MIENKIIEQQLKIPFNGIHKSYENCDSYAFKHNEVLMDKPIYVGFAILQVSKLHLFETYYDNLQQYFSQETLQSPYTNSVTKDTLFLLK